MMYVPAGYVKINGATVQRNDYIRLVNLADKYGLWTTDTVNNPGKFGVGNGSTTIVLPDWRGVVRRFLDDGKGYDVNRVLGSFQGDAIRNIAGNTLSVVSNIGNISITGPFTSWGGQTSNVLSGTANTWMSTGLRFDASITVPTALENRMRNIAEMAVMRY